MTEDLEALAGKGDIRDLYRLSRDELVQRLMQTREDLRNMREQLQIQQITDSLTGLANRDYFFASLTRLWRRAKRFNQMVCMALVDVDNFKTINEQYGHLGGDLVLTGLADTLRAVVRDYDLLARFGEDEFAFAIDNGDVHVGRQLAERVQSAVSELPVCVADRVVPVTVTIGMAVGNPEQLGDVPEELVRLAVEASELARRKGRNQFHALQLAG